MLNINTLGDAESRGTIIARRWWRILRNMRAALSADSKMRLEKNPLRILDSKDEGDQELVADAPLIYAHLTEEAAEIL